MEIRTQKNNITYILPTQEIKPMQLSSLSNKTCQDILKFLSTKESYPKDIAKKLKIHEQNVYYYIRKLSTSGLIEVKKEELIQGTTAKYYGLTSASVFLKFSEFKESPKFSQKQSSFLEPFIIDGKLNTLIVVGSPEPHGPAKARSKDGYFGMDLALFLGSYLYYPTESSIRLDTEITSEELENNNLIILGGPIVNHISAKINHKLPIYFDETKRCIVSTYSKETYYADECGYILKIKSPFNTTKSILHLAGIRNAGTKATILAFLKHFSELENTNKFSQTIAHVVEGVDLDSDGKVDDCEIRE